MDKLKMHSKDKTQENFEILQRLFPNAVTETITGYDEDGKAIVERAIDKDVLQQEINAAVVEGKDERYQFTWPDKKRAILAGQKARDRFGKRADQQNPASVPRGECGL